MSILIKKEPRERNVTKAWGSEVSQPPASGLRVSFREIHQIADLRKKKVFGHSVSLQAVKSQRKALLQKSAIYGSRTSKKAAKGDKMTRDSTDTLGEKGRRGPTSPSVSLTKRGGGRSRKRGGSRTTFAVARAKSEI